MNEQKASLKSLRARAHKLKPVVTVADKGLTESVLMEIERALADHELIKVKIRVGDNRKEISNQICTETGAELIQQIGGIALLLRRSKTPNPKLSNLIRRL